MGSENWEIVVARRPQADVAISVWILLANIVTAKVAAFPAMTL